MAIIRKMKKNILERDSSHKEVGSTYTIIEKGGETYLQIDTYGSNERQETGKKSQSMRFSPEAIEQLKKIVNNI